jgi:hypothetical protein
MSEWLTGLPGRFADGLGMIWGKFGDGFGIQILHGAPVNGHHSLTDVGANRARTELSVPFGSLTLKQACCQGYPSRAPCVLRSPASIIYQALQLPMMAPSLSIPLFPARTGLGLQGF